MTENYLYPGKIQEHCCILWKL